MEEIQKTERAQGFRPILEKPEIPMVSFYYVPTELRASENNSAEFSEKLNNV
jgi:hypothetical protein